MNQPKSISSTTYQFHPSILREYDIRGVIGETLSASDALHIGKSFATFIIRHSGNKTICVGRDGRLSSPELEAALVEGLISAGADVIRVGLVPTPALYFAAYTMKSAGGVMVTGSHNPPNHNGFKFTSGKKPFYGSDIKTLGTLSASGDFLSGNGTVRDHYVTDDYIQELRKAYSTTRGLKIAWDAGNGATGDVMTRIAAQLPGEHILLNAEIDGTFPNHHPDPTVPENLEQLIEVVKSQKCDLGVAFDGDGDRLGIVDQKGRIVWGDQLLLLAARDILKERPGSSIIADVKASQVLFDGVKEAGGNPIMWKTGHSLIKAKMAETGAILAGEMSGHMFFADRYFGYDDGLYAAVRMIDLAARSKVPFTEIIDTLPKTSATPEIRIECDEVRKFAIIEEVKARLTAASANVNLVDGVRVLTPHGWWLLRASNTQAALVARCEALNEDSLTHLKHDLTEQLKKSHITFSL